MRAASEGRGSDADLPVHAERIASEREVKMSKNGSLIASEILIVDDEEDIRDLISGILHDEGYDTRVAGDSDAALAAVRARRPQLVVLDIWLQGSKLDGIQVLDMLKREQPDLPVVMISGHGTIETAVASIKKGAYDFIEKPFKADRLLHVVERALEAARLKREVQELKLKAGDEGELVGNSSTIAQLRAADRQDRAHQQPRADHRSRRLGQGSGGAPDPCPLAPRRQCLCRHQLRHHGAGPASKPNCSASKAATARARPACSSWRITARSISTKSPTCRWRPRARSCAC